MYKYCKSEQSSVRQKKISACLLELMQSKPYKDISITQLCEYADIPRNSFYRYFANKDAVLTYLLDQKLAEFLKKILLIYRTSPGQDMTAYTAAWLREYRQCDALWEVFSTEEKHGILLGKMVEFCFRLAGSAYETAYRNLQTKKIVFYAYGFQGILDMWKHTGYKQDEAELAEQIYGVLFSPLLRLVPTARQASEVLSEMKSLKDYVE